MNIYLIMITILTFIVFGIDKKKARKHAYRISEKTLFLLAALGGSVGALAGMYVFRHKTQKLKFKIGIPMFLLVQILLCLLIYK